METHIIRQVTVNRSTRVRQLEGLFELSPAEKSQRTWDIIFPLEEHPWVIGLVVGPSGSGKTTIAHELWPEAIVHSFEWPEHNAIIDGFPEDMGIKEITHLLSSVGFSSPPSWLRPFHVLSTGEQFRVTVARALAERQPLTVLDEFTSVIDRTVAQIGSAAVARMVRERKQQFIAVSCHYDIEEWLQPDWVFDVGLNALRWRDLQRRPAITLEIFPCTRETWNLFRHHHYLDTEINKAAACYLACLNDNPISFTSVLSFPHPKVPGWRGHRTVCLPDYQGVGIGLAVAEFIASCYRATGKPFARTSGNPVVIGHTAKSKNWQMMRSPSLNLGKQRGDLVRLGKSSASRRLTATFNYIGPVRRDAAVALGIISGERTTPTSQDTEQTAGAYSLRV